MTNKGKAAQAAAGGAYQSIVSSAAQAAAGPAPNVLVRHIEVVQAIQDRHNSVELIADKPTVLRIFLESSTPISRVTAEIAWRRAGTSEAFLPAVNSIETARWIPETLRNQRTVLTSSINFILPQEAIALGQTDVRISKIRALGQGELGIEGLTKTSCTFTFCAPLRVRAIGLRYRSQGGEAFAPEAIHFSYLKSFLSRAYPSPMVEWSHIVIDADFSAPFDENTVILANAQIAAIRSRDVSAGVDPRTHYYGLVSDANGSHFLRGRTYAIPQQPQPDTVATGPAGTPGGFAGDTDLSYADWYGAHELGHTFGRYHPGFPPGQQDASDPTFPYPQGRLTKEDDDFVGLDIGDQDLTIPMRVLPGDTHHDVMTYADNQWVSAYTYRAIMLRLNAEHVLVNPV